MGARPRATNTNRPTYMLSLLAALLVSPPQVLVASGADCPASLEVLVERSYAERAGLGPGSSIRLRADPEGESCEALVVGVFEPRADPARLTAERPRILLHVPDLGALTGRDDEVDHFTIGLRPGVEARAAARELEKLMPGTQVLTTTEVADRSSTTFMVVSRFHRAIGIITLIAGGVFLSCIMILKVQERRAPIAAARLVGIPRRMLMGWTIAEAALLSALGGLAGLALGLAASAVINAYYQRVYDTTLIFSRVTPELILQTLTLAIVLGLGAGVFAGVRLFADDALEEIGR